jgi:hypothetical protein
VDWAELFGSVGDWLSIGPVILLPGLVILLPGFLLSRLLRVRPFNALAVAMPVTIGIYFLLGVFYLLIGVNFNALTVGLGVIILLSLVHLILLLTRTGYSCAIVLNRRFYWSAALVLLVFGVTLLIASNSVGSIHHYYLLSDYYFHFSHVASLAEVQNIFGLNWNYPSGGHFLILFTVQIGNISIFAGHKLIFLWTLFGFGCGVMALARKMFSGRHIGFASCTGFVFTLLMCAAFLQGVLDRYAVFAFIIGFLQIPSILMLTVLVSERRLSVGINFDFLSKVFLMVVAFSGVLSAHYSVGALMVVLSTLIIVLRRTLEVWAAALVMLGSCTLWLYLSHRQFARDYKSHPEGHNIEYALSQTFSYFLKVAFPWLWFWILLFVGFGIFIAFYRRHIWIVITGLIPIATTMIRSLSPSDSGFLNNLNEFLTGIFYVDMPRVITFSQFSLMLLSMYGFSVLACTLLDSPRLKGSSLISCSFILGVFVYASLSIFTYHNSNWDHLGLTKAEEKFIKQVAQFVPERTWLGFVSLERGGYIFPLTGIETLYYSMHFTQLISSSTNQTLCEDYVSPPHRPLFIIQFGESEADPRTAFVDSEGQPLPLEVKLSDGENNLYALNCQTVVDETEVGES